VGVSSRHKHLQVVPLPLAPSGTPTPMEVLFKSVVFDDAIATIPELHFKHALTFFNSAWLKSPDVAAAKTLELYHNLLSNVGISVVNGNQLSGAYNLLATREWMMIVPRSQEHCGSISVNSLGFAGALLVRNEQEMQFLKDQGPMNILQQVTMQQK
jgi:ATP adenylyltransferase